MKRLACLCLVGLCAMVAFQGCALTYTCRTRRDKVIVKEFGLFGGLLPLYRSTVSAELVNE